MIGTLFSIVIGLYLFFNPLPKDALENSALFSVLMVIISVLFVFTQTLITVFAWSPLQAISLQLSPRVIDSFIKDKNLRLTNSLILFFLLFTFLIVLDTLFLHTFDGTWLLILWVLLLGTAIDGLHHFLKRVMMYLDPIYVVKIFGDQALKSAKELKTGEICDWINALSETAVKGILRHSTTLPLLTIDQLRVTAKNYLEIAKSITSHNEGKGNHISFVLFYLFQRLEMIFEKALNHKQEPICSEVLTTLGKIGIYSAKYDVSMAGYPLHYLGQLTLQAQEHGSGEIGNRSIITLTEVSKVILKEVDIKYVSIKELFTTIIDAMAEISKESFRRDKSIRIELLTGPFSDLKQLFSEDGMTAHQDREEIVQQLDRILSEFSALQSVMATLPPLPEMPQKESGENN